MKCNFAGSDPGDSNYGYSVVEVNVAKSFSVKILELGMITCQINNLTAKEAKPPKSKRRKRIVVANYRPFSELFLAFQTEWKEIIKDYAIRHVTSERFQARGLRGKSIECVSMMNAIICSVADLYKATYELPTAASWKNQVNVYLNLEELYKEAKKECGLTPHTIDSVFIAIHGALNYFKITWHDIDLNQIRLQILQYEFSKGD